MKKEEKLKLLGYIGAAILILNVALFSFRVIRPLVFWLIISLGALLVYVIVPRWREKSPKEV